MFFNNFKQVDQFVNYIQDKENIFNIKREGMYVFFLCLNTDYVKKLVNDFEAEFIYNLVKDND